MFPPDMSLILGLLRKNYCQWFRNYQLIDASSNCLYTRFLRYIIHVEQEFYANLPGCIPKKRNCAFLKQSDSKIYLEDRPENLQTQYMATRSSSKDVLVSWDERGHVLFEIVLERCLCSRNHLNSHSSSIFTGASSPCSSSGPLSTQILSSWYEVLQHKLRDVVKRFETCMVTMYHVLHTIHALYICLHGWLIFRDECVGTYTIPVDALSYGCPMTVVELLPDFSGPSKVWMDSPPKVKQRVYLKSL